MPSWAAKALDEKAMLVFKASNESRLTLLLVANAAGFSKLKSL